MVNLPLFPLHTVLCPGIALPIHVFEPRYRLMIDRCVAQEAPFGVVLIREGREVGSSEVSIAGVGTFAEIRQAGRYPDGRYDLLVVGTGRFAIQTVDPDAEPYLVASVAPLDDELGDGDRTTELAARTMRRFVAYLQLLQPMDGETADEIDVKIELETESTTATTEVVEPAEPPESTESAAAEPPAGDDRAAELEAAAQRLVIPDDPTTLSYLLSGIIQVDALERQVLLETDSTEERLAALDELLTRELWMLRRRLRHYVPDTSLAVVRRN